MLKKITFLFVFYFFHIAYSQEDCGSAIQLCGNSSINFTPSGIGNINEPVDSGTCLDVEHHSVWYKFTIATSGTLTFDLVPTGPVDYDWAIFGPNTNCNNLGPAIRCNASGYLVPTGMNMTNTNTSSAAGNTNPYCKYMDVLAGQTYYLYIDNWSTTVYTFNLTWGGTATFVSPFTNSTLAPNPFQQPGTPSVNPNAPSEINICSTNTNFNFSTLSPGILNGNQNFVVNYYTSANNANSGTNPITSPINVNTSTTYYYTITYQDPNNPGSNLSTCKQIGSFVFVNHPITASINASSTVLCPNGSVTLTSNNTTGNLWSTGATTPSITVNSPGIYTLTSSNGYCTSLPASISISSSNNPNVQISGNLILCNGSSTTLTATSTGAGNTYAWSNGTNGATTTANTPGIYTVTVTTANGCQDQQSATVTQGTSATVQNASLHACSSNSTANFDLTSAQNAISTTSGAIFSFYQNLADANAGNTNTISNPSAYNTANTTVYVLVQAGNCPKVAQLQLIVDPIPNPVITASSTVLCNGSTITLTSNYPTGNNWSTGQTSQSISVNTTGTYTLTNTSGNCTSTPASITINPATNPNVQISGNLIFCNGNSTTLTATSIGAGNTYAWSNGTNGATTTANTPGIYTVTVTTPEGCQYQQSATVTQGTSATVQNASLHACSSNSTANFDLTSAQNAISTTSGAIFSFYQNLADANAGNTNTISNPSAYNTANTTVYVLVQAGNCPKVAQLQLIVDPIPNPVITASSTVLCNGSTITLTSNYPTGNTWSTGQTSQSISVNTTGTYTLTNTSGNCTSTPATITINPATNPNVQISGNLSFCQGSSTTLTATSTGAGNTYAWSNGTNGASNTVTTGGIYTVTVTTPEGCQYQQSATVNMEPAVIVNINTPGQISCTTPQITLNASNSVFIPGSTILWTASGGGNIISGANSLSPTVNSAGTYTCTITSNTANSCSGQASVNITGNSNPPTISLTANSNSICVGDSVSLIASGAQTYTWNSLPGTGNTQTVSPTTTTTYSVTGIGANGCPASNTATITINVVPAITSTLANAEICKGDQIVLNAGAGNNYTYLWNTGETTPSIVVNNIGTYNVTINNGVCSENFSAIVTYKEVPEIQNIIYQNSTLTIIATTSTNQNLEYSIDGGFTWQNSNIFNDVKGNSTLHIFVRIIGESCYNFIDYDIFQINNVITPNGDGYNDVLDLTNYVRISKFSAEIYDRYGKIIYRASKENPIWDGTYLGRPLPTESYWYIIKWYDETNKKPVEFTGWILLKNRD